MKLNSKLSYHILYITLIYLFNINNLNAEIIASERQILIEFYQATDGEHWKKNTNWLTTADTCSWFGITCLENQQFELNLSGNNVVGTLPDSFAHLDHLVRLNFNGSLIYFYSSGLILNSNIALNFIQLSENLGNLKNLKELELNTLSLSHLPRSFSNLKKLTKLSLQNHHFSALPKSIEALSQLQILDLSQSKFNLEMPNNVLRTPLSEMPLHFVSLKEKMAKIINKKETVDFDLFPVGNQKLYTYFDKDPNSPYFGQWYYRYYLITKSFLGFKLNQNGNDTEMYGLGPVFNHQLKFLGSLSELFKTFPQFPRFGFNSPKVGTELEYQYKTKTQEGILIDNIEIFDDKTARIKHQLNLGNIHLSYI